MMINHPNYFNLHFVNNTPGHRIHEYHDITLLTHLDICGNPCIRSHTFYGHQVTHAFVTEEIREIIRCMVCFICYLHEEGLSLDERSLNLSTHFVMQDGVVKFWKISFRQVREGTKLSDFRLIHDLIRNDLLPVQDNELPDDMYRFLYKTYTYNDVEEILLKNHLAILSHAKRIRVIAEFFERRRYLTSSYHQMYKYAVIWMGDNQYWTDTFLASNTHFSVFKCACESENPHDIDVTNDLRAKYHGEDTDQYQRNFGIIRLCRNLMVHLPDQLKKDTLYNSEPIDIDLMIMEYFGRNLVSFQESLHERDLLRYFPVD